MWVVNAVVSRVLFGPSLPGRVIDKSCFHICVLFLWTVDAVRAKAVGLFTFVV